MQHCCCKATDDAYSAVSSLPTTNPLHTYDAGNVKTTFLSGGVGEGGREETKTYQTGLEQ